MKGENPHPGRIGPNAILRIIEALDPGATLTREVLERAGLAGYLDHPPATMVEEREVQALHRALRETLGVPQARSIGREGGLRTGDYLLANRIPPLAQGLLKALPAPLAGRLLLKAIARNAWTFTGSGRFSYQPGRPHRLSIAGCAICHGARSERPLCDYYGATFERLFQVLVADRTAVIEVQCQAQGHPACVFEVHLEGHGRGF
ncbi:MAG: bacteriochlorophyll 4-vinyl reductase [Bdellovibrio bacteriovorus]